jgi:hypothetical protein
MKNTQETTVDGHGRETKQPSSEGPTKGFTPRRLRTGVKAGVAAAPQLRRPDEEQPGNEP